MAVIGQWGSFKFEVSPSAIFSINDLQIKAVKDTDTVDSEYQQYTKRKNWKPIEVSFVVHLHAGLGYDVRAKADAFRGAVFGGDGRADYLYIGGQKLVPCKLNMTEATISRVEINAGGAWTAADVALTLKQAALLDGTQSSSGSSGGGSSGGSSTPKKQTVTPTKTTTAKTVAAALPKTTTSAIKKAVTTINNFVETAKKTTSTVKGGGGGGATRNIVRVNMVK